MYGLGWRSAPDANAAVIGVHYTCLRLPSAYPLSLSLARMSLCSLMAIILVAFVLAEQRAEKIIDVKSHSLATRLCCLVTPHSAPPQPCVRVRLFAVNYNVPDA